MSHGAAPSGGGDPGHRVFRPCLQLLPVSVAIVLLGSIALVVAQTPEAVQTRRALDNLGAVAIAWQDQFNCNGCHKQPMPILAYGQAKETGYEAPRPGVVQALFDQMIAGNRGQVEDGCFSTQDPVTGTIFGGRGLDAYDRHFGEARDRLLAAADCLLGHQDPNGSLVHDHNEGPAAQGTINTTSHGMAIWARALELTGDTTYETALSGAETWMRSRGQTVQTNPNAFSTQAKAMLIAGLVQVGAAADDPDVLGYYAVLQNEQQPDGSWKLWNSYGGGNGHGTGQVVYALRLLGLDRTDPLVDTGTRWLLDNQQSDGSWADDFWDANPTSDVSPNMWGALALATYASPLNGLRLEADDETVSWDPVSGAATYDLVRGDLGGLAELTDRVDLGSVSCLAAATAGTSVLDAPAPSSGTGVFYLMRIRWDAEHDIYGRGTMGLDRGAAAGDCPP